MTGEALGPLGRRMLLAFATVTLVAVALVAVAALVGTDRGLTSQNDTERRAIATRVAQAAADAYDAAGGWESADLARAQALAAGGGAALVVLGPDGTVVWSRTADQDHGGTGMGHGQGMGLQASRTSAEVTVGGRSVGRVVLGFGPTVVQAGRPVAWAWILVAAVGALLLAFLAAWFVSRQLTRPVTALTVAARSFAAGDRNAAVPRRGTGELADLADAFEDAVEAVRRAEQARSRMAADVAHELRTPLAALQAGLEELRDGLATADAAHLARLHDQSLRVAQIVGDLDALFAAEGAGRAVHRAPVDVALLAEQEVAARGAQMRAAGLEVSVEVPSEDGVWALGDEQRLHQVLGNLLENCVRHCRPGDAVRVRVTPGGSGRAAEVALSVADTGPGIAPEELPHVFDRFWRGARQDGRPGSGLGLAVVRSLVEAQDGSVTAESDASSGSTFTVALPRAPARPRADGRTLGG